MTAQGRITAANIKKGTRLIVAVHDGRPFATPNKTGQLAVVQADPTAKLEGGTGRRKAQRIYTIVTDVGTVLAPPAQTFTLAPDDAPAAAPAKAAKVAKAPAKGAAPEKAAAAKAAPAKKAPAKAPAEKVLPKGGIPKGYEVRWPHASFDLAKKMDKAAEGTPWLVICNLHGTTTGAANAGEGDQLGSAKGRPAWCKECKALADAS